MAKFGSRNLKKGSTGSDVRELQTKLNSIGYNCGKVDGIFGTKTLAAVKRFQQAYKLAVDGIVGKNTYAKLASVLAGNGKTTSTGGSTSAGGSTSTATTTKTTTTSDTKTSTSKVTLMSGEAPATAEDELRVAIQTKGSSSTANSSTTDKTNSTSGNTSTSVSTTTKTTTVTDTCKIFYPPIEGEVTWDTERTGSPGKVTFKVRGEADFTEGDIVSITYGKQKVFMGYVFERSMDKSGVISVTAYDQTKYFNNTDTYVFEKKKASDVLKQIANDYKFSVGIIEDTAIVIPSIVEDNQSLFDIVYNALDKTVAAGDKVFVFYDDYGKLTLKSLDSMRVNLMLCEDTVVDYDYTSSIEDEVYNQIVLYYDNKDTNKREYFTASGDSNIKQWGILRKTESVNTSNGAQNLANVYLAMYNKKTRKLSIKEAFGRPDVRAGTLVPVIMKVGDVNLRNYMLVEKASHKWSNGQYFMDLDLAGAGEFSV